MTKILIDEATVKLALEALGWTDEWRPDGLKEQAITALREALAEQPAPVAKPHEQEFVSPGGGYVPAIPAQQRPIKTFHDGKAWPVQEPAQQDSTCNNALRIQGKAYPRTCKKCGLGPCVELAQQALDKKAENAKELGLDYEPAQQEPVQKNPLDCGVYLGSGKDHEIKHHVSYGPAQQEPVAWTNWRELVGARHYRTPGWEMYADKRNPDDVAIYISPPAQRTWVGLTNKDVYECEPKTDWYDSVEFARAIEARLKEKNT